MSGDEKRLVDFILERRCFYNFKKALNKEEFEELCKFVDWGEHGADIAFIMGDDVTRDPDDFDDSIDCLWENFDDYPIFKELNDLLSKEGLGE